VFKLYVNHLIQEPGSDFDVEKTGLRLYWLHKYELKQQAYITI